MSIVYVVSIKSNKCGDFGILGLKVGQKLMN